MARRMEQKYKIIQFWVFSVPCVDEENYMFNMMFNYNIIKYETLLNLFYYVKFVYQILLCVTKKKYIMYKDQDY